MFFFTQANSTNQPDVNDIEVEFNSTNQTDVSDLGVKSVEFSQVAIPNKRGKFIHAVKGFKRLFLRQDMKTKIDKLPQTVSFEHLDYDRDLNSTVKQSETENYKTKQNNVFAKMTFSFFREDNVSKLSLLGKFTL